VGSLREGMGLRGGDKRGGGKERLLYMGASPKVEGAWSAPLGTGWVMVPGAELDAGRGKCGVCVPWAE